MAAYENLAVSYDRLTNDVDYEATVAFYNEILKREGLRPLKRYEAAFILMRLPHQSADWFAMTLWYAANQGGTASICKIAALGEIRGRLSIFRR